MAIASLAGMEMWCGRWASFSPFIDRRNCAHHVSACAHTDTGLRHQRRARVARRRTFMAGRLRGGYYNNGDRRAVAVCAHCTGSVW